MSVDDPLLTDDARGLVADLTVRNQSVATAESLTAGLLAATLAGVPGASEVLRGGLITYTEHSKIVLAGVAPQILDEVGPVAAPTARALAVGARQRCAATWGVGLTGVAGPEPHGGHQVGTVFMGLAGPELGHRGGRAAAQRDALGYPHLSGARVDQQAARAGRGRVNLLAAIREPIVARRALTC